MAHSAMHFSLGMIVASAFSLPPLVRAWQRGRLLSGAFLRWFVLSGAMGAYAVLPGVLRRCGVPDRVCDGWWMNVFLFYPWLNRVKPGAMTSGPLLLGLCLALYYGVLVAAIVTQRRRNNGHPGI